MILNECKNKTLLIITHDKEILPHMNRTINLNEINKNNYFIIKYFCILINKN